MRAIIYLVGTIDGIAGVLIAISAVILIAVLVLSIIHGMDSYYDREETNIKRKSLIKKYTIIGFIILFIASFIPSSKTIAAMVLIPKIASNKDVQEIPSKAMEVLNLKLDEYINDLKKGENK